MESSAILYQNYWTSALKYWRDQERRSWILVCPASIGDTWGVCALAQAFRDTHGGPLTIVVKESQQFITQMFPKVFDRIIVWDDLRLAGFCQRLIGQGAFAIDEPIIAHQHWHGLGRFTAPLLELLRYQGRGGLRLADQFRLVLQLGWESKMSQPIIPKDWYIEAKSYALAVGLDPGNSVILLPDSNTNPILPDAFWEKLVAELTNQGNKVFTNMAGSSGMPRTTPFKGSHPISLTIKLGIPLIEQAGRFISMVNGYAAMLLGSEINAEHTVLINDFPAPQNFPGPGFPVTDPIAWQTVASNGFSDSNFNEFVVNPDHISQQLIRDITANNPEAMLKLKYDLIP
jgi:hypothetical protein